MKTHHDFSARLFVAELFVYAAFVVAYLFLVVRYLSDWITGVHADHRVLYSVVALALIVGQGVLLESLTSALMRVLTRRR